MGYILFVSMKHAMVRFSQSQTLVNVISCSFCRRIRNELIVIFHDLGLTSSVLVYFISFLIFWPDFWKGNLNLAIFEKFLIHCILLLILTVTKSNDIFHIQQLFLKSYRSCDKVLINAFPQLPSLNIKVEHHSNSWNLTFISIVKLQFPQILQSFVFKVSKNR